MTRGDTLGGINLTVRITAPAAEIIRVQVSHHLGGMKKGPSFELNMDDAFVPEIREIEDKITVKSGSLSLCIDKVKWSMRYERDGKTLTGSAGRDLAYMRTDWRDLPMIRIPGEKHICVRSWSCRSMSTCMD